VSRLDPTAQRWWPDPHDHREGVLFFVQLSHGTMTLIFGKFEIIFTHNLVPV